MIFLDTELLVRDAFMAAGSKWQLPEPALSEKKRDTLQSDLLGRYSLRNQHAIMVKLVLLRKKPLSL